MEIASGPFSRRYFFALPAWLCPVRDPFPPCTVDAGRMHRWLLTPSIGQVPYDPIPKQLSHEALDTSGKGIPASLKVHPCLADGIPTSIPCKRTKDVLLQQDILAVQSEAAVSARKSAPVSLIPAMADDCSSHRVRRDTLFCRVPAAAKVLSVY